MTLIGWIGFGSCEVRRLTRASGPVHTYPDIFESATFFSGHGFRPANTHPANSPANLHILKSALQSEKNNKTKQNKKSSTNLVTCGRMNPDSFKSDDVANSSPVTYWTINQYGGTTATTEHICRHYRALYGACSEHWVLEWTRIPTDGCGQTNSIWILYVWTGKFLKSERKSWGYQKFPDTCGRGLCQKLRLVSLFCECD